MSFMAALALAASPVLVRTASSDTLDLRPRPSVESPAVIDAAQRIKAALMQIEPCPPAEQARFAIGAALEGVTIDVVQIALELAANDPELCVGARQGVALALEDVRLVLAATAATGATQDAETPAAPRFITSLGGVPGGAGGSGYRRDPR
jgi:hypothetical protein